MPDVFDTLTLDAPEKATEGDIFDSIELPPAKQEPDVFDKINLTGEPRGGFGEFVQGLDLKTVPKDVLQSLTPLVGTITDLKRSYQALHDVVTGKRSIGEAEKEYFPESQTFVGIEKKPMRDRLAAGLNTAMQLAFAKQIGESIPFELARPSAVAAAGPAIEPPVEAPASATQSVAADEVIPQPPTQTVPETAGAAIQVPSAQIAARPDVMQFKEMDNQATGTAAESRITTPYDPYKAGNLLLWEPQNPQEYGLTNEQKYIVANGHYRNEAAQEQNVPIQNAQIIRESAGVSPNDARAIGAWSNIADGKGTIYDQARFIRAEATSGGPGAAVERARQIGARSRKAETIAVNAAPDLYTSFINEQVTPEIAASIADAAPNNAGLQRLGIERALKGDAPNDIANFLQATQAQIGDAVPAANQVDLFAADDVAMQAAAEAAKRAGAIQREIGDQISAVQGAARRPEKAAALGVNVTDPASVLAKLEQLRQLRERARNWAFDPQIRDIAMRSQLAGPEAVRQLTAPETISQESTKAGSPELKLAPPESDPEMLARQQAEASQNQLIQNEAAKQAQVKYGWQQKLTGTAGDLGQMALPGEQPQDIFGFGPGAASVAEQLRPSAPTAKQLADLVQGTRTGDPAKFAQTIGRVSDQVHSTKTGLTRAWQSVKSLATGFKRIVWDAPTVTNFDRWKGRWDQTLQYNDHHIKRLGNELEKAVLQRARQEAIYNWAAADGNETLLREWADKAPADVKQGYLDALTLTDDEQRIANLQRSAYDEWLARAIELGMLREGAADYMKRIVIKRPEIEADLLARLGTGKFSTNFKEGKRRFWDIMVDAERAGIRYDKRIRGQSLYAQSFEHAAINRKAVRQFFDSETESGRPFAIVEGRGIPIEGTDQASGALLVTSFGARNVPGAKALAQQLMGAHPGWSEAKALAIAKENILAEYAPLNHPAFKNWQWVNTLEDGTSVFVRGDALVHQSILPKLQNAFEKQRLDWLEPILRAQGFVKGSKLSLSLFHNVHEAINAIGHLTNPANLRPLSEYLENPVIKTGMEAGLKLVGSAHEQAYFAEGAGSHGWPELVPIAGEYIKAFKDASFEDWIPRLKAEAYLRAYERNTKGGVTRLRPTKRLSPEQNAVITARQVNATFGELNYRQMMHDPRFWQALQGVFLAPDFGAAKVFHIGQAFTRYGSEQRMAIGLVAAGLWIGSRILNQAVNGNPYWNKPFAVVVGDRQYTLRSLPGDLAHLLMSPTSYVAHRLSPAVQNGAEWLFHRDLRGQVTDWSQQVKDFFLSAVPIPLTRREGLAWKDQVASAMGITPMKYRAEIELRKTITDFKKNSNDPKLIHEIERSQRETFLPSDYQPMQEALREGNLPRAQEEYHKVLTVKGDNIMTRMGTVKAMQHWAYAPFTGSMQTEVKFNRTLSPEDRQLYDQARRERQAVFQAFMNMIRAELSGRTAMQPSTR